MIEQRDAAGDAAFERFAGAIAIVVGIGGIVYAVAFLGLVVGGLAPTAGQLISSASLLGGGVLSIVVLVALYRRLRVVDEAVAVLGFVLGVAGAVGAAAHGGYDLANAINPPAGDPLAAANLPNLVDPRGLLTFGVAGLAIGALVWLMRRDPDWPSGLVTLGSLAAILLVLTYLGRLVILSPTNPLVAVPAALLGLIVNPAWYVWLGRRLLGPRASAGRNAGSTAV